MEAEFEASEEFHERWRAKAREVMTDAEWRRRQKVKREKEEQERAEEKDRVAKDEAKSQAAKKETWEKRREKRVGNWGRRGGAGAARSRA